ncbi:MAG: hypothetical protein ACI9W7_001495, partial [Porticoccaceae bacterium]
DVDGSGWLHPALDCDKVSADFKGGWFCLNDTKLTI